MLYRTNGSVVLIPSVAVLVPVARALFMAHACTVTVGVQNIYSKHQLVVARVRAVYYCSVYPPPFFGGWSFQDYPAVPGVLMMILPPPPLQISRFITCTQSFIKILPHSSIPHW